MLHTNSVPSISEFKFIKQAISEVLPSISQLEAEVDAVETMLLNLKRRCDALRSYRDEHQALLSSNRRLPTELLLEIFTLCIPQHLFDISKVPTHVIGQVCRRWAAITLSTPRLWSYFSIKLHRTAAVVNLMKAWLERSRASPLSIRLDGRGLRTHLFSLPSKAVMQSFMDDFVTHCQRWRELRLCHLPSEYIPLLAAAKGSMPLLQTLSITGRSGFASLDTFEFAPQLRTLVLCSGVNHHRLKIPWQQLNTCDVAVLDLRDALDICQRCPNLTELTVNCPPTTGRQLPHQAVLLGHLVSLTVYFVNVTAIFEPSFCFFDHLDAPALRELHIMDYDGESRTVTDSLLRRLQKTPLLVEFELRQNTHCFRDVLVRLTTCCDFHEAHVSCFLPLLQVVKFVIHVDGNAMVSLVADVVRSRRNSGGAGTQHPTRAAAPLKVVQLTVFDDVDLSPLQKLRDSDTDGLQISVTWEGKEMLAQRRQRRRWHD